MNHNETGFLQIVRQKGKHPFPDAYAENKLSEHFHHRPTFEVCTFKLNRRSPRFLGRDVSFTGLRSIQHWRIAD
jgi:hypothetical protein